jgi:hypothetical protein
MESPGTTEIFIPLEKMDCNYIDVHVPIPIYPIRVPVANISYKNTLYTLPRLSIFTKLVNVVSWDSEKFRLELSDAENFGKLQELQESIIKRISENPEWSNCSKISIDEVRVRFQPIITKGLLSLYINSNNSDKINVYTNKTSKKGVSDNLFYQGQQLRIALRFQGIFFMKNSQGKLFYRLQHQINSIFL